MLTLFALVCPVLGYDAAIWLSLDIISRIYIYIYKWPCLYLVIYIKGIRQAESRSRVTLESLGQQ